MIRLSRWCALAAVAVGIEGCTADVRIESSPKTPTVQPIKPVFADSANGVVCYVVAVGRYSDGISCVRVNP